MANYNVTADSTTITIGGDYPTADYDPFALAPPKTNPINFYLGKITPWQADPVKARFLSTVSSNIQPYVDSQSVVAGIPEAYDLDEAVGAQLDVVGQWIGRDRYVSIPIPDATFALGIPGRGLGQGYWRTNYDAADSIYSLPDDLYRRLLYAKILANSWDGTAAGAIAIVRAYLTDPDTIIFVNDDARAVVPAKGDLIFSLGVPGAGLGQGRWKGLMEYPSTPERMGLSYAICIAGKLPSRTDLYILANDLLPVKGLGANVRISVTSIDQRPIFGLGMNNGQIGGLGVGALSSDPATVAASLTV